MNKVNIDIGGNNFGDFNFQNKCRSNPSHLGQVVNELAKIPFHDYDPKTENVIPFDIEDKIRHNDLGKYEFLIEEYCFHMGTLNTIYEAVDEIMPASKTMIRSRINKEYKMIRGELLKSNRNNGQSPIEVIRVHSDKIIDKVLKVLNDLLTESSNLDQKLSEEAIKCSLEVIIADAFIECKILENPNGNHN